MIRYDKEQQMRYNIEIERQASSDKKNIVLTILGIILCIILVPLLLCNIILITQLTTTGR